MPLIDRKKSPPGNGFPYREPSINWEAPKDGAVFDDRVKQIMAARRNNKASGLDPSRVACEDALDLYTCTRLKNNPKWCVVPNDPVALAAATSRATRCAGCGVSRRKKNNDTSIRDDEAAKHLTR